MPRPLPPQCDDAVEQPLSWLSLDVFTGHQMPWLQSETLAIFDTLSQLQFLYMYFHLPFHSPQTGKYLHHTKATEQGTSQSEGRVSPLSPLLSTARRFPQDLLHGYIQNAKKRMTTTAISPVYQEGQERKTKWEKLLLTGVRETGKERGTQDIS